MKTNTEAPETPKIPDLQRQVTELKERLAIAKKRVISTKESHKRAKKAFKLAKRDAKGVRKKLKVLNRSLDEATVAAIAPRSVPPKKRRMAAKKSMLPQKTKPRALRPKNVAAAQPEPIPTGGATPMAHSVATSPGL